MTIDYRIRNFLIAAALAVTAAVLTIVYVASARDENRAAAENVTVYTASKSFDAGTSAAAVASTMEKTTVTRDELVTGAVTNPAQLEGLYLTQPVVSGEQLTLERFALPSEQGVRAQLTGVQRAVQVAGDANQVLRGTLVPGDRVDVVANIKAQGTFETPKVSTILRDIRVLSTSDADGSVVEDPSTSGLSAVVLGVTDAQAQRLYYAMRNGDWSLVLRPVKKPKDSSVGIVTSSSVLAGER